MNFRKLLVALVCGLSLLTLGQTRQVHGWFKVKPYITVIVNDPSQIRFVDLLIPLEEAPVLLDEEHQPIDHPLNGYLTPDGYGSASLYSTFFTLLERTDDDTWNFQSETKISTPFYVVIVETSNERYLSEQYAPTYGYPVIRWTEGVFSIHDPSIFEIALGPPIPQPWYSNLVPYLVIFLIALLNFPLLIYTGYRQRRTILMGGLIHVGLIVLLAVLNHVYHINNDLVHFLILAFALSASTVGEATFFALAFRERSTARAIGVSMLGMFVSSFILFYYMGLGVFQ